VFNIINGFVGALISPSPGDYNFSFQVEQGDLDLVLLNWGDSAQPPPDGWFHDFPEGIVDQEELDRFLRDFRGSIVSWRVRIV
jgi:hypothetical protein